MNDPVMEAFDVFADAVEAQLAAMREEIKAFTTKEPATVFINPLDPQNPAMQKAVTQSPDYTSPGFIEAVRKLVAEDPPVVDVRALIDKSLAEALATWPVPQDGKDGADSTVPGPKGDKGDTGGQGERGEKGADSTVPGPIGPQGSEGIGIKESRLVNGNLVFAFSDGVERNLGRVEGQKGMDGIDGRDAVGHPGKDGLPGRDGVQPEQIAEVVAKALEAQIETLTLEGREVKLGDRVIGKLAVPLYVGTWKEGEVYEKGDMATWGGHGWHCNVDAPTEKPGTGSQWKMAVKAGRDRTKIEPVSLG